MDRKRAERLKAALRDNLRRRKAPKAGERVAALPSDDAARGETGGATAVGGADGPDQDQGRD